MKEIKQLEKLTGKKVVLKSKKKIVKENTEGHYTFAQQQELDKLLNQVIFAQMSKPEKLAAADQRVAEWKKINGDLKPPIGWDKDPVIID